MKGNAENFSDFNRWTRSARVNAMDNIKTEFRGNEQRKASCINADILVLVLNERFKW